MSAAAPGTFSEDARRAALLLAVDPVGLGGVVIRAACGPVRDAWLALLRAASPPEQPWRRLPLGAPDSRLLGGMDFAGTLASGQPVVERGILAEADGGIVVAAMAERLEVGTAARIASVLDRGEVSVEREGVSTHAPARITLVALDEGIAEEAVPPSLRARLAIHLDLSPVSPAETQAWRTRRTVARARALLPGTQADDRLAEAFCAAARSLGIDDLRAPLLALRSARASAALAGRRRVGVEDAELAARLVLAPRATVLPAEAPPEGEAETQREPERDVDPDRIDQEPDAEQLREMLIEATRTALPPGLLAAVEARAMARKQAAAAGRSAGARHLAQRGRPVGTRTGALSGGARLALVETLRTAAPWQELRRRERPDGPSLQIRSGDIRLRRFRQQAGTTAIFIVDASGSAALHRLAEAKGAVELLLADCYVRRDQVAVVAFRGRGAEVLLPPTPSLVRAKRSLSGLPGGGATPLASGLDIAAGIAAEATRRGRTPLLVLLTDGRANVARDGTPGRTGAEADALASAASVRGARLASLLVDMAPRPHPFAKCLSEAMGARYLPLPAADAARLSGAVTAARGAA